MIDNRSWIVSDEPHLKAGTFCLRPDLIGDCVFRLSKKHDEVILYDREERKSILNELIFVLEHQKQDKVQ